ncbi:MAG: RNA polymerase sigma factor [Planctomycetes bacterium]|nr:RNA polymerase sigma factor [Planctomycetota bacterium]
MAGDDRKLVSRCLAGDSDALRTLVETYQGPVYGLCFRMVRHREDAEDITQEVMLRAIRHLKHWDRRRPLRPWILTIAANRCRTHLSKQSRQPVPTDQLAQVADEHGPEHDPDLAAELQLAIAALRPEYRLVVSLFHEQELPYEEISEVIGRPVGTVKTWLHRARAELARLLAKRPGLRDMCRQFDQL